jgi:hypothetical protein
MLHHVQLAILQGDVQTEQILTVVCLPLGFAVTDHDTVADRTDAETRQWQRVRKVLPQTL